IFVAICGSACDGHDYIEQAISNGAKYIVCQRTNRTEAEEIVVEDSSKAAAILAQASRGNPARQLTNLAVTGTNGKTTVAYLVHSVIKNAGFKCGLISTILYDTCAARSPATLTSPDCLRLAEMTRRMVSSGAKYMVTEASSHALVQNRLAAIDFRAAAFTNLSGDHLDYHKQKENYLAAKMILFETLSADAAAVLNKQSPEAREIAKRTNARIFWYAIGEPADINAQIQSADARGTVFLLKYKGQQETVKSSLLGPFNVSNHLAAAGLCLAAGFDLETIAAGLSALRSVPGRLEKVDWNGDFSVFIDYAHTDDALTNVLSTLKTLCTGKLTVVFGCGGDRDKAKRPRMAKAAENLADKMIVTSDNPRNEKPLDIIDDIVAGFQNPDSETIIIEADRKKAIELAINTAGRNDIVLIAGKGHETYQIIENQRFDFNDKEIAGQYLRKRK
ncbi:MAG: UDP-N-acetylmuramoyl-L-alanyl-D-glutamate--2,6-diaminopimelate ligase, partial [Sedimentisphaerales bacterium]|nr:UDP-N-acetylmuramoyl-L-alanyl-D-glutamate--2,6-diaminopimelate ligase [Sedimentisphaerales bacterium]